MHRTVNDLIRWAAQRLRRARLCFGHGTDNALDEAAWLVGSVLGLAPHALTEHLGDIPDEARSARIRALVAARIATRKPLAYLLNEAWFAGLKFYVDERVLVPRSLTAEFIAERFTPWIEPARVRRILDLCTGSGCMAIAAALAFPAAAVDAVDISPEALAVAGINVERYGLGERVTLISSDLFAALGGQRYDVIIANPPYVSEEEWQRLPPEYRHEPKLALVAGVGGLDILLRLLAEASRHLEPGGILVVEAGGARCALEQACPHVPFVWLTSASGDESVFLLTAEQL